MKVFMTVCASGSKGGGTPRATGGTIVNRVARPTSQQRRGRESQSDYYRRTQQSALGSRPGQPLQRIKQRGR